MDLYETLSGEGNKHVLVIRLMVVIRPWMI